MASFTDLCLFEDEGEISDLQLLIAFNELRHREKIEGSKKVTQTWRMKERVSVHRRCYIESYAKLSATRVYSSKFMTRKKLYG